MNYNFTIFECLVSLAIMAFIWFHLLNRLRRDDFRSRIRRIRDGLFDEMWRKGYAFDTSAYQETRQMLNGIIRISRELRPTPFFLSMVNFNPNPTAVEELAKRWHCEDPGLREVLHRARAAACHELLRFVFLSGLFGIGFRLLVLFLRAVNHAFGAKKWAMRKCENAMEVAYVMGGPSLSHC